MIAALDMSKADFQAKMDDLVNYYNTTDDYTNGHYLKDNKYWYLWYGKISYGYVDTTAVGASLDGSCENRVTFYTEVTFKCFNSQRRIKIEEVSDTRKGILKLYAKYLKEIGTGSKQLNRLAKTFPEMVV